MDANSHPRDEVSYDAADPVQVRQRQLSAKRREKADRDVLTSLMSSPDGRAWIWSYLSDCHCFALSFDRDPYQTAFNEGERNAGQKLLAQINRTCPDLLIQAQKERADG